MTVNFRAFHHQKMEYAKGNSAHILESRLLNAINSHALSYAITPRKQR